MRKGKKTLSIIMPYRAEKALKRAVAKAIAEHRRNVSLSLFGEMTRWFECLRIILRCKSLVLNILPPREK